MELLELLDFVLHAAPLAQESQQLVFELRVELSLDAFDKVFDFVRLGSDRLSCPECCRWTG